MNRKEKTEQKMQELFHSHAAGDEGTDGEFMQILQGYIFGDVCYTGSLDNRMRELVTVTVLTTISALPQICLLYTSYSGGRRHRTDRLFFLVREYRGCSPGDPGTDRCGSV